MRMRMRNKPAHALPADLNFDFENVCRICKRQFAVWTVLA